MNAKSIAFAAATDSETSKNTGAFCRRRPPRLRNPGHLRRGGARRMEFYAQPQTGLVFLRPDGRLLLRSLPACMPRLA